MFRQDSDLVFYWAVCRPNATIADLPRDLTIEEVIAALGQPIISTARFDNEGGLVLSPEETAAIDRIDQEPDWFFEHEGREARKQGGLKQLGYVRD